MKKIILVIAAVALLASPAMAVDWNFYGNARMATFYVSRDFGNGTFSDLDGGGLVNGKLGKDEDAQVQWDLQTNSRIGARVKAENIGGRFEFAVNGIGGANNVGTRLIYGTWNFGAATLKVGKDYGPVTQFTSGQVFGGDNGLLGQGAAYGSRVGQVALAFGGFEIAALTNPANTISNITTGDTDVYLPRLEAKFGMSFDTWNFTILGGYNYYEIEDAGLLADKSVDVTSYILGGDVGFNFGPAYIRAAGSFGENWDNAGWFMGGFTNGEDAPGASYKGGTSSSTDDVKQWQAMIAGGFKFTDQLSFEAGYGYYYADPDASKSSNGWAAYGQAVIAMAPGVFLIPEVGYETFLADYDGTGFSAGKQFYLGGKWQINF